MFHVKHAVLLGFAERGGRGCVIVGRDCFASKGETMNAHASDKTRILALAAVATLGFGLLQGARLLDLNTGPYSPSPYALVGLVADGLTFLVVAVLSYVGRIDRAKPLFVTAVVVSSIYAVLVASGNTNDIAGDGGHGLVAVHPLLDGSVHQLPAAAFASPDRRRVSH